MAFVHMVFDIWKVNNLGVNVWIHMKTPPNNAIFICS